MSSIVLLGIGIVLVILFWAAKRGLGSTTSHSIGNGASDSEFLVRLPRPDLIVRCLSADDISFARSLPCPAILDLLLHERRRLALEWLRRTRREASRLFRLHLQTVRHAPDLRPSAEVRLAAQLCAFLIVYEMMSMMVRFYGPIRTQAFLQSMRSLAELLCGLSGRIADSVSLSAAPSVYAAGAD